MELSITQPFFELDNQDFAWKIVWTIQKNGQWASMQKENLHGNPCKKILWIMELAITQPFFELQTPDFAWKFVWTVPTKWTSMQRKIGMESMQENSMDHGIGYNSAIFWAR